MKYSLYALERERAESARFSSHTIARGSACPHTARGGRELHRARTNGEDKKTMEFKRKQSGVLIYITSARCAPTPDAPHLPRRVVRRNGRGAAQALGPKAPPC